MIDFDNIDEWGPLFEDALSNCLPISTAQVLVDAAPTYVEDARNLTLELGGRDRVVDAT